MTRPVSERNLNPQVQARKESFLTDRNSQRSAPPRLFKSILITLVIVVGLAAVLRSVVYALTVIEQHRYPPPGSMIDIGGYKLLLYCTGHGSPAVLLESGLGATWVDWNDVVRLLGTSFQVCVYDRAGYGWSNPGPKPRTSAQIANELHTLLKNSGILPPYILVGHSYGTFDVRLFAADHPDELAGLVLVDPSHEDHGIYVPPPPKPWRSHLPKTGVARLLRLWHGIAAVPPELRQAPMAFQTRYVIWSPPTQIAAEKEELSAMPQSAAEVKRAVHFGDMPTVVITASSPAVGAETQALNARINAELAGSSTCGCHVLAEHSSHFIQLDEPAVVVQAINYVQKLSLRPHSQSETCSLTCSSLFPSSHANGH